MDRPREERLRQKRELYSMLEALEDSDNEPDSGREASEAFLDRSRRTQNKLLSVAEVIDEPDAQSSSAPRSKSKIENMKQGIKGCTETDGPAPSTVRPSARKNACDSTATAALPKVVSKRKRETTLNTIPEDQQIFRGLDFYFFPNNNVHPARKMRIAKALEYGAVWHKDWSPSVSHIILDKIMTFESLMKFLKLEKLPPVVVVVSENYPAECIAFRHLLDPKSPQFAVKGYQPLPQASEDALSVEKASLPLKPARRAVVPRQPVTPSPQNAQVIPATVIAAAADLNNDTRAHQHGTGEPRRISDSFVQTTPELDEAIAQAQAFRYIPLDDEETRSRPTSSEGSGTGDMEQSTSPSLKQRKDKMTWQDKFQCMQKHTGEKAGSLNSATIEILQQMADYYVRVGDEWRSRGYRKAIATLRIHPSKISTREEAVLLPNIGDRLATKIEEIVVTNRLQRLENTRDDPDVQALQTFMGVYGAGFGSASKWVGQGFKTLDELLEKADLTENQRIGVQHYADFNSRIPRAEVEQHGNIVRNALRQIDPDFTVIVGGSYRRGSPTSGDIDCVITHPRADAARLRQLVLGQLVSQLTQHKFFVAALATTSRDDGSKWHGASCLPGSTTWRRMDLLLVPADELGAALIYFTGNDIFNRSLRLLASKKGMRLNQRGLYRDVMVGKGRQRITEGTLIEGRDEKRIFEILGVPWRPPEHRIC